MMHPELGRLSLFPVILWRDRSETSLQIRTIYRHELPSGPSGKKLTAYYLTEYWIVTLRLPWSDWHLVFLSPTSPTHPRHDNGRVVALFCWSLVPKYSWMGIFWIKCIRIPFPWSRSQRPDSRNLGSSRKCREQEDNFPDCGNELSIHGNNWIRNLHDTSGLSALWYRSFYVLTNIYCDHHRSVYDVDVSLRATYWSWHFWSRHSSCISTVGRKDCPGHDCPVASTSSRHLWCMPSNHPSAIHSGSSADVSCFINVSDCHRISTDSPATWTVSSSFCEHRFYHRSPVLYR